MNEERYEEESVLVLDVVGRLQYGQGRNHGRWNYGLGVFNF